MTDQPDDGKDFNPDWVSPPGDTLLDWMEENGIERAEMAVKLGLRAEDARRLLAGTLRISHALADKLGHFTKVTADFWLNREDDYRQEPRRTETEKADDAQAG